MAFISSTRIIFTWSQPRVAGLSPSVHPKLRKGVLSIFYHVIEYEDDENELRFKDASIHKGHLRQNGILTLFGIETAKKIRQVIKS